MGVQRPVTETTYTPAGLVAETRFINLDGTALGDPAQSTGAIKRSFDAYGRLISYTDGSGLTSTTSYDAVGRLSTVTNDRGSRTVSYDENGERGSLPTSIAVSEVGTFTARYGADGTLVRQGLPGGITAVTKTDPGGEPVSLSYSKANADGTSSEWLRSTATLTGFGQVGSYRLVSTAGATGAVDRTTRYGYDDLGRLITATDGITVDANGVPSGAVCTRSYGFDLNSNRTSLAQSASAGAPGATCPSSVPAADSYGYDTADRLQPTGARVSLRYDGLGRTRTLPAVDTADGSGDVAVDYYVDDLVRALAQGAKTTTFGLDAAARRTVRSDSGASNPTVSFYTGDDDNPDVVRESDNSWTRNIAGFGGLDAVVTLAGTAGAVTTLQLANLHGDIAATVPATATAPADVKVSETTEYGEPRAQPAAGSTQPRYGWLGSHQRDASTPGGLVLMGVRLYAPPLGRFLSVDHVAGGSANDYDYSNADPVNMKDIDGRFAYRTWLRRAAHAAQYVPGVIGTVANLGWSVYYASRGQYGKAAMSLAGAATFGVTRYTGLIGKVVQRSSVFGKGGRLFGRGKTGLFNRNDYARLGWSWKGSAKAGRNVFRLGIGSKRGRIHLHYTMMKGGEVRSERRLVIR